LQGATPNAIFEFNVLMQGACMVFSSAMMALLSRGYLEAFNRRMPFNRYLLNSGSSESEISESIPEEVATDGLLNSRGCVADPFVVLRVEYITYLMRT
jgi:hypothetical protein